MHCLNFEHKFLFALKKIKLNKAENIAFLSGNNEVKLDDFKISNLVGIPALVSFSSKFINRFKLLY